MQHQNTIACFDELLRKITSIDKPFGGKVLLAVGNFRQTAPIVSGAGKSDTIAASIQSSHLWPAFHILRLHAPIRTSFLSPLNLRVDEYNDTILDLFPGEGCTYSSTVKCFLIPLLT